jgi:hypothetical protein
VPICALNVLECAQMCLHVLKYAKMCFNNLLLPFFRRYANLKSLYTKRIQCDNCLLEIPFFRPISLVDVADTDIRRIFCVEDGANKFLAAEPYADLGFSDLTTFSQ